MTMEEISEGRVSNTLYPEVMRDKPNTSTNVIFRWIFSVLGPDAPLDLPVPHTTLITHIRHMQDIWSA